jgi:hypothetical protein
MVGVGARLKIFAQARKESLRTLKIAARNGILHHRHTGYAPTETIIPLSGIQWQISSFSVLQRSAAKHFTVMELVNAIFSTHASILLGSSSTDLML